MGPFVNVAAYIYGTIYMCLYVAAACVFKELRNSALMEKAIQFRPCSEAQNVQKKVQVCCHPLFCISNL